ncbi:class I SAM-dependent methyltransferase [Nocardioidaceae bacterium]|nr:class I SAM-dependent methyltransferase [Nocardioidaceae bacterium]
MSTSHPVFARFFSALSDAMEDRGLGERRAALLDGLTGHVVEVGAGDGSNFRHYPGHGRVEQVTAVEPETWLRAKARGRAAKLPLSITVVDGAAEDLPVRDRSVDGVVFCLVLCSVADVRAALDEAFRVLRPGGTLRVLEHVAATGTLARGTQRALDATVWPALFGGCHTARDPLQHVEAAGFRVLGSERVHFPDGGLPTPVTPHLHLRAVKPS